MRASQREANVALVASDPSCQWGPSIIITGTNGAEPLPRPLCSPPPANLPRGDFDYKLSSDYRSTQRAAGLANALAAYSAAVGAIVAGDEIDARDSLAEAFGIASALQSDLATIAGTRAPIDDAQSAAIGKLVGLINELNVERIKVEQLRTLVATQKEPAERIAADLKDEVDVLTQLWKGDIQVTSVAYRRAMQLADAKGQADFSVRRDLIGKMALAEAQARDTAAFGAALKQLIGEVEVAHGKFIAALDGNFSAEDRREMSYIARDRLVRAINSFAGLVAAF